MKNRHVDVVIVGAGAGGGVVAKELAVAGLSVVLLERGPWANFEGHDHDEITSQRTPMLGNAFGPDDLRHRRVVREGDAWRTVVPSEWGYNNNAACVGSGTLSYGAMAWRFMEQDFRMRTTYGAVPGSTLEDWPLSYQDLEPFYEKAEWELGVAGDASANPFAAPRRKALPMPPHPLNTEAVLLSKAAQKLGLHPFPIPMLRNSVPYGGRPACIHCRFCCGYACEVNAKAGTQNTVIPVALATGHCEVRTGCMVSEVQVDERGRATGVTYFDAEGHGRTQTADVVVLACSATETPRLLLNSRSRLFPTGAGNRSDWVGRNLQGHAYSGALGILDEDVYDDMEAGATLAICDFNHGNPGIIGGGLLANEFLRPPYQFATTRPPGEPSWGKAHKDFQRRNFKRTMKVVGPVQELPVFESRVEVDPIVKDAWGIPVARISGHRHPEDLKGGAFLAQQAERWLKAAGASRTWLNLPGSGVSGGQHQAGTCRMGNDPKVSVTNRFGQVHDIDNLFIADGSLNVTNGGFNPALTIMALGYWVSAQIQQQWKGTRFRS